ncbi:MAG: SPOR domain-containing protein [Desulfobacteraceae bacterium]
MIPALRNTAIRLWIAAITGIPLLLILLPLLDNLFPDLNHLTAAAVFILGIFLLTGYAMNLAGQKRIAALVREAEKWTRAGIYKKGEHCYLKAVRIFDSFLLSPWQRKKPGARLTASMAGFCLAAPGSGPLFNSAVSEFLLKNPHEEEIALFWLTHIYNRTPPDSLDHEILSRMAHVDFKNPDIPVFLADIFLEMNSTDLAARKVYHHLIKHSLASPEQQAIITELLGSEKGLAPETDMSNQTRTEPFLLKQTRSFSEKTLSFSAALLSLARTLFQRLKTLISACIFFFRKKQQAKAALKVFFAVTASSALVFFIINTINHLLPDKMPVKEKKEITIPAPYHPFTIQVAAYLNKDHADAYVARLKKKGLDAYLVKVYGGGKAWFLVRISRFTDKQKASEYGNQLKAEGKIDDFFVDNREK